METKPPTRTLPKVKVKEWPMAKSWNWETGTAHERAETVRSHWEHCFSMEQLRDLFSLTDDGCRRILNGDDWRPLYEAKPSPPSPE